MKGGATPSRVAPLLREMRPAQGLKRAPTRCQGLRSPNRRRCKRRRWCRQRERLLPRPPLDVLKVSGKRRSWRRREQRRRASRSARPHRACRRTWTAQERVIRLDRRTAEVELQGGGGVAARTGDRPGQRGGRHLEAPLRSLARSNRDAGSAAHTTTDRVDRRGPSGHIAHALVDRKVYAIHTGDVLGACAGEDLALDVIEGEDVALGV